MIFSFFIEKESGVPDSLFCAETNGVCVSTHESKRSKEMYTEAAVKGEKYSGYASRCLQLACNAKCNDDEC